MSRHCITKDQRFYFLGQYNESIGYYDKVLTLNRNHVETLYNKGVSLAKLGQNEEAIRYFDKVLVIGIQITLLFVRQQAIIYWVTRVWTERVNDK